MRLAKEKRKFNYVMLGALVLIVIAGLARHFAIL